MKAVEATDGMEILPGTAVIAPGGEHLKIAALIGVTEARS